jgi:hypothetical protein
MPIKPVAPQPVTMIPAPDAVHQRLTLDDVAEWVTQAQQAGVLGAAQIKSTQTLGGWLKTLSATPAATNG